MISSHIFTVFSCYRLLLRDCGKRQDLERQYFIDFGDLIKRDTPAAPLRTASGRTVKRRYSLDVDDLYTVGIKMFTRSHHFSLKMTLDCYCRFINYLRTTNSCMYARCLNKVVILW